MKTCTFLMCFLLSAIASFATAPKGGYDSTSSGTGTTDGQPVAPPFTICLEAENANSNAPISPDPNASGGLTRGFQDASDYWVQYQTDVPASGKYLITLRYYAEQNSPVNVSVNNTSSMQVELPASHSWNIVWKEHTFEVVLHAGNNWIRITELPGYNVRHDKACWKENGPSDPGTCDINIRPVAVGTWPIYQPGQSITLDSRCTGGNCTGTTFTWSGNGLSATGPTTTFNAPTTLGDYFYAVTASKAGCPDTTASVQIRVQNTPAACDYVAGAFPSTYSPDCGQGVGIFADCYGTGCGGLDYRWTGPGISGSGTSPTLIAPSENGIFTYTLTTSKAGCADKTSEFKLTITDCGDGPFKLCLESEDQGGSGPITEDPNASGGKTRGAQDRQDYSVYYLVPNVKVEGTYAVTFRYYAEANTAVEVNINGDLFPHKVELPSSNSWNIVWTERTIVFALKKGINTIQVKGLPGYSPVRHDKICIEQMSGNSPACDFNVTAHLSTTTPQCGAQVTMTADCTGPDCGSVFYNWYGPEGFARYTQNTDVTAPSANGTYYYTLVAGKDGCANKNIQVSYVVNSCSASGGNTSACVEAENSASNGAGTSDPNASNGQTRGSQNDYNYYVDYQLNDFKSGTYAVTLRYYAEANAQVSVSVNGNSTHPVVQLPPTHSWNIVAREETFYVTIPAGNSTIRIQGLPGAACRQDKICVGDIQTNARMATPEVLPKQTDSPRLQAYPNPAPGEFKAAFYLQTEKAATLLITDTQGKVWHQRQVSGKGSHEELIDLGNAPSGIYLLQVKKPDSVETKKILYTR